MASMAARAVAARSPGRGVPSAGGSVAAGADEVARGEIGRLVQDALQPRAARPAVGGPGEAEVGLAQERQVVVLLQLVELAPGADGGCERLGDPALRQPGRLDVVGLA